MLSNLWMTRIVSKSLRLIKKALLSRWKLRWSVERSRQPSRGGSRHQGELRRPGRVHSRDEDEGDVEDEEDVEDEDDVQDEVDVEDKDDVADG